MEVHRSIEAQVQVLFIVTLTEYSTTFNISSIRSHNGLRGHYTVIKLYLDSKTYFYGTEKTRTKNVISRFLRRKGFDELAFTT